MHAEAEAMEDRRDAVEERCRGRSDGGHAGEMQRQDACRKGRNEDLIVVGQVGCKYSKCKRRWMQDTRREERRQEARKDRREAGKWSSRAGGRQERRKGGQKGDRK